MHGYHRLVSLFSLAFMDVCMDDHATKTTREHIVDVLRAEEATASQLSARVDASVQSVYEHVRHVARSLSATDEQLLVAPPACGDCGFDDFDDLVNEPSRCPDCRSENISEAVFTIESD